MEIIYDNFRMSNKVIYIFHREFLVHSSSMTLNLPFIFSALVNLEFFSGIQSRISGLTPIGFENLGLK